MYDKKKFKSFILEGQFDIALEIIKGIDFSEIREELIALAFDTGSIAPYTFTCYLLIRKENNELHELASEILTLPLSHLTDAYRMGLFHAKKALELNTNDLSLQEYLLFYHTLPDKLLSDEEAEQIAKNILKSDLNNSAALSALKDIKNNKF